MVHPADTPDHSQLQTKENGWLARDNDAPICNLCVSITAYKCLDSQNIAAVPFGIYAVVQVRSIRRFISMTLT